MSILVCWPCRATIASPITHAVLTLCIAAAVAQLSKWRKAFEQKWGRAPIHVDCAAGQITSVATPTNHTLHDALLFLRRCLFDAYFHAHHIFAAGMLPLLKMARSKLDQHMQQQQQQHTHKHSLSSNASPAASAHHLGAPAVSGHPLHMPAPPPSASLPSFISASVIDGHEAAKLLSTPVAPPPLTAASPATTTPGTLVKTRHVSAIAPLSYAVSPSSSTAAAARATPASVPSPSTCRPAKTSSLSKAASKVSTSAADSTSAHGKSVGGIAKDGWSASAFARSLARGRLQEQEQEHGESLTDAPAHSSEGGSLGGNPLVGIICFLSTVSCLMFFFVDVDGDVT